ncbi:hypothetical protein ACWEN6_17245 [Sphaerisporangium sp. NPDC004334]
MSPAPTTPPSIPADPPRTPADPPRTPPGPANAGGWIGYAAAAWAATYGVVALFWTMTGTGYPFGGPASGGDAPVMRVIPAEIAAPVFAGVLLATAVAALAMAGRHAVRPRGVPRAALLTFGYAVALSLMVLVPGADLLALTGYAPMLILGAPFGRPKGIDYSTVFDWSLLNQAWSLAGGFLVGAAVLSWQRRGRGACGRCGRDGDVPAAARARTAAWARRATAAAVVIPLLYSVSRLAWLAGIPLGIDRAMLRGLHESGGVWAGAGLATFAVVGAVLTLGLVQRWGEVFPRWMPGIAGRRVPVPLAVIPAAYVSPVVFAAGLGIVTSPAMWHLTGYSVVLVMTHALWPLWGVALAVATYGYHLRRRTACRSCGRKG